jgi:hypothetical protein
MTLMTEALTLEMMPMPYTSHSGTPPATREDIQLECPSPLGRRKPTGRVNPPSQHRRAKARRFVMASQNQPAGC